MEKVFSFSLYSISNSINPAVVVAVGTGVDVFLIHKNELLNNQRF